MPLQGWCAKATTPKPRFSPARRAEISFFQVLFTVLEPGAQRRLHPGLAGQASWFALRAIKPAAIMLRGVAWYWWQLVIAAMITAPSGILPSSFSDYAADTTRGQFGCWQQGNAGFDGTRQGAWQRWSDRSARTALVIGMVRVSCP